MDRRSALRFAMGVTVLGLLLSFGGADMPAQSPTQAPVVKSGTNLLAAWPTWVADMLLTAYAAAVDRPALVTSAVEEVTGTPARTFHQWASDHAADFAKDATPI